MHDVIGDVMDDVMHDVMMMWQSLHFILSLVIFGYAFFLVWVLEVHHL